MTTHDHLPRAILDHAVVNVRSALDPAEANYRRLGFHLTPRGHHSLGSSNHLAVFKHNYLELLGFPEGQEHRRPELLSHPLGLSGLAFRASDAVQWHRLLKGSQVTLTEPRHFSRPVRIDEADPTPRHEARFSTFQADFKPPLPGRVFFCQHHTPELVWRKKFQAHDNGATDIIEFVVVSAHPEITAAPFRALFADIAYADDHSLRLQAETAQISFTLPEILLRRTGIDLSGQPPDDARMAALVLRSSSLELTAGTLRNHGVSFAVNGDQQIIVPPEECFGLTLIFSH